MEAGLTVLLDTNTGLYEATGSSDWDFCEACGEHRSDASRGEGHEAAAKVIEAWWADNSVPVNLN